MKRKRCKRVREEGRLKRRDDVMKLDKQANDVIFMQVLGEFYWKPIKLI